MSEEYEVTPDTLKDIRRLVYKSITKDLKGDNTSGLDIDRGLFVLTYLSNENLAKHSENLVKQSEKLNCWTKVIAFTTIALILFTIAQIVLLILLRQ